MRRYREHSATDAATSGPEAVVCKHSRWAVRTRDALAVRCGRCLRLLGVRTLRETRTEHEHDTRRSHKPSGSA